MSELFLQVLIPSSKSYYLIFKMIKNVKNIVLINWSILFLLCTIKLVKSYTPTPFCIHTSCNLTIASVSLIVLFNYIHTSFTVSCKRSTVKLHTSETWTHEHCRFKVNVCKLICAIHRVLIPKCMFVKFEMCLQAGPLCTAYRSFVNCKRHEIVRKIRSKIEDCRPRIF